MVKIMENPLKMDDLGGNPPFKETPISLPKGHLLKMMFRTSQRWDSSG